MGLPEEPITVVRTVVQKIETPEKACENPRK